MLHFMEPHQTSSLRLGAILAGGQSRRYGSMKHLAEIGGTRLVERVAKALEAAGARPVLISGPHVPDLSHVLPCRQDLRPGLGPLSGLHTALLWARELGLSGALCVACDMPFVAPALLRRLAEIGERTADTVIAPESEGPRGLEPLCAWYPRSAAQEVEVRLDTGARSLGDLLAALTIRRLPLAEVAAFGDPDTIFMNVNTPTDGAQAEEMEIRLEGGNGRG